jgi:flagellar secretion chaperone FliS
MNPAVQNEYLITEVMTATPQKLQLMLIEAAMRSIVRAKKFRELKKEEKAGEAILKTQEIVTELISGLNPDPQAEIARKLSSVYNFVFRSLVQAHVQRTNDGLDQAMRVLEIERETWQLACQQFGSTRNPAATSGPHIGAHLAGEAGVSTSMSFEA